MRSWHDFYRAANAGDDFALTGGWGATTGPAAP